MANDEIFGADNRKQHSQAGQGDHLKVAPGKTCQTS